MSNNFAVRFESLMDGTYGDDNDQPVGDLFDLTVECMDLLDEVTTLEANVFTFEAAKHVKKAKSGKKKVKTASPPR